jgi:hypothetical protein
MGRTCSSLLRLIIESQDYENQNQKKYAHKNIFVCDIGFCSGFHYNVFSG